MGVLSKANRNLIALTISCVLLCGAFGGGFFAGYRMGKGRTDSSRGVDQGINAVGQQLGGIGDILDVSDESISGVAETAIEGGNIISEAVSIVGKLEESEQRSKELIDNSRDGIKSVVEEMESYLAKP